MIPHEAEVSLAATIIANPSLAPEVLSRVKSSDFANRLATSLIELVESGKATNPSAVAAIINLQAKDEPLLSTGDIYSYAVPPSQVAELAGIVKEYSMRRAFSMEATKMLSAMSDPSMPPIESWSKFVASTSSMNSDDRRPRALDEIMQTLDKDEQATRLYTGDYFYDTYYYAEGGSRRGQLEYILAAPGHGKSTYLTHLAYLFANAGNNVLWFQYENTAASTARRLAFYQHGDWMKRVVIADNCRTFQDAQLEARRIAQTRRLDVVIFDYLQIMGFAGIRQNQIRESVVATSSGLRAFAKFNDCYVISAAQADRMKDRKGYEAFPRANDGRESSQIESDAFVMTSIFRPHKHEELRVDESTVKSYDGLRSVPKTIVYAKNVKNRDDAKTYAPFSFLHEDRLIPYDEKNAKPYQSKKAPTTHNAIAARIVEDEPNW